jgi:hypothetical protein
MNPNLVEMSLNEVESIKTFDDEILSNVLMGDRSMFGFLKGGKIVGAILDRLSDEYTSYLTKQDKTVKNNIKRDIEILKGEVKRKINMNINILNSYIPNKNNEEGLKNLIVKNELFLSGNNLEKLHDLLTNIKSRYEYVNERLSRLTDSGPSIKESIDIIENCKRILELVAKLDPEYLKTSENDSSGKDVDKDSLKNAVDEILQRYNNTEQSNNTRQVNTTTSNTSQNTTGDLDEGIKMINTIKTVLGVTNSTTQIPLLSRLINMMDDDVTKLNIESVLNKVKMDLNVYRKLLIGISILAGIKLSMNVKVEDNSTIINNFNNYLPNFSKIFNIELDVENYVGMPINNFL